MVWQEIAKNDDIDEDGLAPDEVRYQRAARRLRGYAVGVGEDHEERQARDVTIRLINNGFVRRLFLECNSNLQTTLNDAVSAPKSSPGYTTTIANLVTNAGPRYVNPVPLGDVATTALDNLVPVHFIDLDTPHKTYWKKVILRDAHAAQEFNRITARTGTVGCLVLFGGHHLHQKDTTIYRGNAPSLGELLELPFVTFRKN